MIESDLTQSGASDVREPPKNVEAEQAILGAALIDPDTSVPILIERLHPEYFYQQRHRVIFRVIRELFEDAKKVSKGTINTDIVSVANRLEERGDMERAGGRLYLNELLDRVTTTASLEYYADIVKKKAVLRALIQAGGQITELGYDEVSGSDEVLDRAESLIFDITASNLDRSYYLVNDFLYEHIDALEELHRDPDRQTLRGLSTGFRDLDELTSGMQSSDLVIIAGRPGTGKTSFALSLARHAAVHDKAAIGIFSLEMTKEQLLERLLCGEAKVSLHRLRGGYVPAAKWRDIASAAGKLQKANVIIDDTPGVSVLEIRAKARRMASQYGLDMLIVDYIQLVDAGVRTDVREQEIAYISRSLKKLARELSVPVIALSQLSRAVERRESKRPMLSDLRECVAGETLVVLSDGRRVPIRELVGTTPEVVTLDEAGKLATAHSDLVWKAGSRPVFRITLASGRSVRATAEHKLYGADGWAQVKTFKVGDRLALSRRLPEPVQCERWPDLRVALLGQMIGDGSYLKGQPMRYTTASEDNSRIVEEAAVSEFGANVKRYPGRGNWHQLLISGNGNRWHPGRVNAWLRELGIFGERSHEKRVPEAAFRLANEQVSLLLRHLWATYGTISVRKEGSKGGNGVHFTTCSRTLASDVVALLLRLGIVARIQCVEQRRGKPVHMVVVSGAEAQIRFLERVGAFGPRVAPAKRLQAALEGVVPNTNVDTLPIEIFSEVKRLMAERGMTQRQMAASRGTSYGGTSHFKFAPSRQVAASYAEILNCDSLRRRATDDRFWDRIVAIELDGEEDVFDLTVPSTACWLADGIVSHNSGAIEQDADVVMFIYREDYYNRPEDKAHVTGQGAGADAEVIIAKQRHGPPGTVIVSFNKAYASFYPRTPEEAPF